jgi:hypothetical protein
MTALVYGIPAFGDTCVELMTDFLLPSLAAPGNIPAMAKSGSQTVLITTTEADRPRIEASPVYAALQSHATIKLRITDNPGPNTMTESHNAALQFAADSDHAAAILLNADTLLPDNCLTRAAARHTGGASAVYIGAFRTARDHILAPLAAHRNTDGTVLAIDSRALTTLSMRHIHPSMLTRFWTSSHISNMPSVHIWDCGGGTLLMRGFHLHVLLCRPTHLDAQIEKTLDAEFLSAAVPDTRFVDAMLDSDEAFLCETTPIERDPNWETYTPVDESGRLWKSAVWCHEWYDPQLWHAASFPFLYHSGEIPADIERVIEESATKLALFRPWTEFLHAAQHMFHNRTVEATAQYLQRHLTAPFFIYGTSSYAEIFLDSVTPQTRALIAGFIDQNSERRWHGFDVISADEFVTQRLEKVLIFHPVHGAAMVENLYCRGLTLERLLPSLPV